VNFSGKTPAIEVFKGYSMLYLNGRSAMASATRQRLFRMRILRSDERGDIFSGIISRRLEIIHEIIGGVLRQGVPKIGG
jgi:hypothetical protein